MVSSVPVAVFPKAGLPLSFAPTPSPYVSAPVFLPSVASVSTPSYEQNSIFAKPVHQPLKTFHPLETLPDEYFLLKGRRVETPEGEEEAADTLSWWDKTRVWSRLHLPFHPFTQKRGEWVGKLQLSQDRSDVGLVPVNADYGLLYKPKGDLIGKLCSNGELQLNEQPGVWDVFNNPYLQLHYQELKNFGFFGQNLLTTAFEHAMQNNIAPYLRAMFPQINGEAQQVAIIDFDAQHVRNIQSILKSPNYGIVPQAKIELDLFEKTPSAFQQLSVETLPRTQADFDRMILSDFLADFNKIQVQLVKILSQPQPPAQIVISLTMERLLEYSSLVYEALPRFMPMLQELIEKGEVNDPALEGLMEAFNKKDNLQIFQTVIDYVDHLLDGSPDLQDYIANYQALCKKAVERNVMILVSAGNSQTHFARGLRLRSDALLNFLGNSDDVVLVGGSDPKQSPTINQDDKVAVFSNLGYDPYSQRGAPTLLAPALMLPIDTSFIGGLNDKAFNNGTSLATPWVAGIVALMREANPKLSVAELKALLQQACENPEQLPSSVVGYGFLNPFKAIQGAMRLA
jgi:hypothetical protein